MRKSTTFLLGIIVCAGFMIPALTVAEAATSTAVLEKVVADLQAELSRLKQAQVNPASATPSRPFRHSFGFGATDVETEGEVSLLQEMFSRDKAIYPAGVVSGYFGLATERALRLWQRKNNIVASGTPISTGYGRVGKRTREALNKQLAKEPVIAGALVLSVSQNIVTSRPLTKSKVLTNLFTPFLLGVGTGTKVTFAQTGLPAGVTVVSGLSCVAPCVVENRVTISSLAREGVYPVSVRASAGKEKAFGAYLIEIEKPIPFAFTLSASGTINVQKSLTKSIVGTNDIIVSPVGADVATVRLTQHTKADGVTLSPASFCTPPCAKHNVVSVSPTAISGVYPVYVTAAGGGATTSVSYDVIIRNSDEFGFHVELVDPLMKEIVVTRPVAASSTHAVPFLLVLDGGRQTDTRVVMGSLPRGISASIGACTLPCTGTLRIIVGPTAATGTHAISFNVYADYLERTATVKKTFTKSFTEFVRVVSGVE